MNQGKLLLHQQDACVIEYVNFMYIERQLYHIIEGNKKSSIYQNFEEYVTDSSQTDHQQIADRTPTVGRQLANRSLNRVSRPTVTNLLVFSRLTAGQ